MLFYQKNYTIFSFLQGENMDPIENVLCYMGKRPCDNVDGKYIFELGLLYSRNKSYSKRAEIDVTSITHYYMF